MSKFTKSLLTLERGINKRLALDRDDGLCAICFFKKGKRVRAIDVHHVFGRARDIGNYRESYKSLLCLCREDHDAFHRGVILRDEVEYYLAKANEKPINRNFNHEE